MIRIITAVTTMGILSFYISGCASLAAHQAKHRTGSENVSSGISKNGNPPIRAERLAKLAMGMLDPSKPEYNPSKGKTYLEFALKQGGPKSIDMPASTLLELLKSERVAIERSHTLEQQLEIMKEIDTAGDASSGRSAEEVTP